MKAYYDMARLIAEIALTKPDQEVSDARVNKEKLKKRAMAAAKAHKSNPKNPRYKKDLADTTAKLSDVSRKASKPMTHEKDPNF